MGQHATIHGKNSTPVNGASGSWIPVSVGSTGQLVIQTLSGELSQFNRLAGGAISPYVNLTATGVIRGTPTIIYGYVVTTAMSAAVTTIYDNASAASGTVLFVIPASQPVGFYALPAGVITNNGAYASFAGTGTVNFIAQ